MYRKLSSQDLFELTGVTQGIGRLGLYDKTLKIIDEQRLSYRMVLDMVRKNGNFGYSQRTFESMTLDDKINRAVTQWYDRMIENRRKLLINTSNSGLYFRE